MHVLLAIRDPQAAAIAARALRKTGMTVDIAMNDRIVAAMLAGSSYDVVVFEQGLARQLGSREHAAPAPSPVVLEISTSEAADPDRLTGRVRALEENR